MSIRKYKRRHKLVKEAACSPAMLNVKNQLINKLGDDFIIKGASTVPKITIQSKDYPDISFDVTESIFNHGEPSYDVDSPVFM